MELFDPERPEQPERPRDWNVRLYFTLLVLILLGLCFFALSGCTSTPTVDIQAHCLPLVPYSPAQQSQLAAELHEVTPGHPMLAQAMLDYEALRDADRACEATPPAPKAGG